MCTNTDLEIVILRGVRERRISYATTCLWNPEKKMTQMNLFIRQKQTHEHGKQTYGYQKGKWGWGDKLGARDSQMHTTLHKIDKQGPTV